MMRLVHRRRLAACALALVWPWLFSGCRTLHPLRPNSDSATGVPAAQAAFQPRDAGGAVDPIVVRASAESLPATNPVQLHLDLARVLDSQGQPDLATAEYQKAVAEARPERLRGGSAQERARLHRRLGNANDRLGRFDDASGHYRQAQKLAPDDPDVWNDAGYSAYLQGYWNESERLLRKAIALDPTHARALTNLGLTLAASGRVDEAFAMLSRAGSEASAHANLAYVLAAQGEADQAREHYRQAITLQPELNTARQALATLDAMSADLDKSTSPQPAD
jgi:Flp pilus assembly protein TadD